MSVQRGDTLSEAWQRFVCSFKPRQASLGCRLVERSPGLGGTVTNCNDILAWVSLQVSEPIYSTCTVWYSLSGMIPIRFHLNQSHCHALSTALQPSSTQTKPQPQLKYHHPSSPWPQTATRPRQLPAHRTSRKESPLQNPNPHPKKNRMVYLKHHLNHPSANASFSKKTSHPFAVAWTKTNPISHLRFKSLQTYRRPVDLIETVPPREVEYVHFKPDSINTFRKIFPPFYGYLTSIISLYHFYSSEKTIYPSYFSHHNYYHTVKLWIMLPCAI